MVHDLILASGSPRRKEYLSHLGLPFRIEKPDVDESSLPKEKPFDLVKRLSELKALAVSSKNPDSVVIAADTVVAINDEILGKPKDRHDAFLMIKKLQGKTHKVYTGTTIQHGKTFKSFVVSTSVTFDSLDDETIKNYVSSGECDDKSGSYALQGLASIFVSKVEGSVSCVVGLPINEVRKTLLEFGLKNKPVKI